jgi:hypothetical protein
LDWFFSGTFDAIAEGQDAAGRQRWKVARVQNLEAGNIELVN